MKFLGSSDEAAKNFVAAAELRAAMVLESVQPLFG